MVMYASCLHCTEPAIDTCIVHSTFSSKCDCMVFSVETAIDTIWPHDLLTTTGGRARAIWFSHQPSVVIKFKHYNHWLCKSMITIVILFWLNFCLFFSVFFKSSNITDLKFCKCISLDKYKRKSSHDIRSTKVKKHLTCRCSTQLHSKSLCYGKIYSICQRRYYETSV